MRFGMLDNPEYQTYRFIKKSCKYARTFLGASMVNIRYQGSVPHTEAQYNWQR